MFRKLAFSDVAWDFATQAPIVVGMLGIVTYLFVNRRKAPRPCFIAAISFLVLFVLNCVLAFFRLWMNDELASGSMWLITPTNYRFYFHITNMFSVLAHCIGACVIGWCVVMDRPNPKREPDHVEVS